MNSALKPVLATPGPQPGGGQASPAKANVAAANHSVGLPQGAQSTLHIGTNNLVGQNLTHHAPPPPLPTHAPPSMAPVSANMAQMAQNMSHHGNLSHVSQNSVTPVNTAVSPVKSASTSAPLSLVAQEKAPVVGANPVVPLALTRTPEKKELDSTAQSNGTVESPKLAANAPAVLKAQNPEFYNDKIDKPDIAKNSPSTPKPPEKAASTPSTPQKPDTPSVAPAIPASPAPSPAVPTDGPSQPKVATANEPPEKSPSKPSEPKPPTAPTADVAPIQSDNKPKPESANGSQSEKVLPKVEPTVAAPKPETTAKPEPKKEPEVEKPVQKPVEEKKVEPKPAEPEPVKKEELVAKVEKPVEKVEEKKPEKPEVKAPVKPEVKATPKTTLKLATVTPTMRKRRQVSPKAVDGATPAKKPHEGDGTPDARTKRNRTQVQLYQSPTPELTMATKLSASAGRSTPTKQNDDKLIVFYKNEYLAVRNAEGGFYVCQAMQNVYRTTRKIKIRWLSQDKVADPSGETYKPDFYDVTDMECVLTTLSLSKALGGTGGVGGAGGQVLKAEEQARATSILQRALTAESAPHRTLELTEEHPDGLDLSLYKDESQLDKKSRKRTSSKSSPRGKQTPETNKDLSPPAKRSRPTPRRSPKSSRKSKPDRNSLSKKRTQGTSPPAAPASKTATAVTEKSKGKSTPNKRTPTKSAKVDTPVQPTSTRKGRRSELKPSPIVPTPSTSTGKTTRTPRKPPAKK